MCSSDNRHDSNGIGTTLPNDVSSTALNGNGDIDWPQRWNQIAAEATVCHNSDSFKSSEGTTSRYSTRSNDPPSSMMISDEGGYEVKRLVSHNYHDRSNIPPPPEGEKILKMSKGGVTEPFPLKLHRMLTRVEEEGLQSAVSWQPHGRCFHVHDNREFVEKVLCRYFAQKKPASFQRQLNLYGFIRITSGPDKGSYYHEYFLRGKEFLIHHIIRRKIKGTGARLPSNPNDEPDFYNMTYVGAPDSASSLKEESKKISHSIDEKLKKTASMKSPLSSSRSSMTSSSKRTRPSVSSDKVSSSAKGKPSKSKRTRRSVAQSKDDSQPLPFDAPSSHLDYTRFDPLSYKIPDEHHSNSRSSIGAAAMNGIHHSNAFASYPQSNMVDQTHFNSAQGLGYQRYYNNTSSALHASQQHHCSGQGAIYPFHVASMNGTSQNTANGASTGDSRYITEDDLFAEEMALISSLGDEQMSDNDVGQCLEKLMNL